MSNSSSANDYGEQRSDRLSCNPRKFHDDAKSPKFPSIEKPTVLGEFSLDRTRAIQSGRGNVRYIYDEYLKKDARFAFDLSQGFETFDQKNVHEKIDVLLKWIMKMSSPGDNLKKVLHECNFVCWRGLLTRVASMPFEKGCGEGNKIACCLFNGVVFMCEFDTELKITKLENETDFSKQMTYWGFKFEQYVTTDDPEVKPSTSEPVSTWNEFTVVFRSTIGPKGSELNVLYGAEVDCINRKGEYVELKTQFKALGIGRFYDSKTMKWWIQSYLAGIRKIFVGIRTDRGIVNSIEEVVVNELRDKAQKWQASICMKFLHTFLHRVRDILFSSPEGTILLAERNPSQEHVQFTKLSYEMPEYEKYNLLTEEFKLYFSPRGLKRSYS